MFLAIDVGNSNIHLGLFQTSPKTKVPKLLDSFAIPVSRNILSRFFGFINKRTPISGIVMSDACGITSIRKRHEFSQLKKNIINFVLLTPEIDCGLKIKYHSKSSLGTDRIADCVAAYTIYKKDCLVVDFGTATTFNAVSKNGKFLGGLITPGITKLYETYPKHLIENVKCLTTNDKPASPKLQRGEFTANAFCTSQAVESGLYFTIVGTIEKIKREMEAKLLLKLYTVATGGGVNLIPNLQHIFNSVDENLTLKGLAIIYKKFFSHRYTQIKKKSKKTVFIRGKYN